MHPDTPISDVRGDHAVVLGGAASGCAVVAALAPNFRRVTLLEKGSYADVPEPRRYVPQERHVHLILLRGMMCFERLFPGLTGDLAAAGAEVVDQGHGVKRFHQGRWVCRYPTGVPAWYCTRNLFDRLLRRRVTSLPNVTVCDGARATGLMFRPGGRPGVTGVMVERDGRVEQWDAALVVDACGRGSQAAKWLADAGFGPVPESRVLTNLGYASRIFNRRQEFAARWNALLVLPTPPQERAMGVVSPIEGGRWLVTTGGWFGAFPKDEDDFLPFLRRLPVPEVFDVVSKAEPVSAVSVLRVPGSRWRHFERLPVWPDGLLVVGDAVCCLNPLYSQGVTIGALQAEVVAAAAREGWSAAVVQARLADVVLPAWEMARAEDLRHRDTVGSQTLGLRLRHWYGSRFAEAAATDRLALQTLVGMTNLVTPRRAMYRPALLARVAAVAFARAVAAVMSIEGEL